MFIDVLNSTSNIFKQTAESIANISKTGFASGVDFARSLIKPISNVSGHDANYGGSPSTKTTTYDKQTNANTTLSSTPQSLVENIFGVIKEKVISPIVINSGSQTSNPNASMTNTLRTTGLSLVSIFANSTPQESLDLGYNIISSGLGITRPEDENSKTTEFKVDPIKPAQAFNPSNILEYIKVNPTLMNNTGVSGIMFIVLIAVIILLLFKK